MRSAVSESEAYSSETGQSIVARTLRFFCQPIGRVVGAVGMDAGVCDFGTDEEVEFLAGLEVRFLVVEDD